MTPERLAQIRAHFKNPPSATVNVEWALELCDEVERLTPLVPSYDLKPHTPDPSLSAMSLEQLEAAAKAALDAAAAVTADRIHYGPPIGVDERPIAPAIIDDRPKKKGKK